MNSYEEDLKSHNKRWERLQKLWPKKSKNLTRLFHLAKTSARNQIIQEGIVPNSMSGPVIFYNNRVFLLINDSKLYEIQEMTGKHTCQMDLWEIDNSELKLNVQLDEFAKDGRCCYVTQKISPEHIKLVKTIEPYI